MSRKTIAVLGATGNLGRLIATHLAANPDVDLRLLVRPESRQKLPDVAGADIKHIDVASASPGDLDAALEGATCVVSALQGGPEIIVEAQGRLLAAARAVGVARFIPSSFSYDIFGPEPGQNVMTDQRRQFADLAEARRGAVEVVHILIGCFMERGVLGFIGALDVDKATAQVWGAGREAMDFTTYDDAAAFTAAVAADDRARPRVLGFAGATLDARELVATFERETGRAVAVEQMGSLPDLSAEIDRRRATDPGNLMAYLPLMYWRSMLDGSGKLKALANADYPAIQPTTFPQYLRQTLA